MISDILGNSFNSKNVLYLQKSLKKGSRLQNLTDISAFPTWFNGVSDNFIQKHLAVIMFIIFWDFLIFWDFHQKWNGASLLVNY